MQLTKLERTHRIDSEFYSKENLKFDKWISSVNHLPLTKISNVSDGNHMAISEKFIEKGIPYYRGQNIHSFFIEDTDPICIDEKTYSLSTMKRSHLKKGDVLLSIVGTIGGISLVTTDNKATCNCKLAILRKNGEVNEKYLAIYLSCRYGQSQIERYIRGAVQKGLILEDMDQLSVPIMSFDFQNKIASLVIEAKTKNGCSKEKYNQAENLLISELGLENFNPSNKKVSIKTLKESFLRTGRLDSEYYQPKYDEILNKITKYGCSEFTNFVDSYTTGYPYSSDSYVEKDGIALIKISNINNFKLDISSASLIPKNDIDLSAENVVQKNDILVSMSGTIGNSCIVQDDIKAVVNQRIMKIKSKNINPVVFSLIINSMIGKNQLERIQTGGVQANISPKDILKIQIPCIKTSVQDEIAGYIKQSLEYSKKAKELLEISTKSVEIAIDKDETAAHNFLEQNRTEQNRTKR